MSDREWPFYLKFCFVFLNSSSQFAHLLIRKAPLCLF